MGSQRVLIKDGTALDEQGNEFDLDHPDNAEIKEAIASRSWSDGTYRFDKAARTLVNDGGGARTAM